MPLQAGDIVFVGWDSDNNNVVFLSTSTIAAGEVVYFTDTEWNGSNFVPGEQVIEWTVTSDIAPGQLVTIDMTPRSSGGPDAEFVEGTTPGGTPIGSVDYLRGGGALARANEQFWAVQGSFDGTTLTPNPDGFISVISNEAVDDDGGPVLTGTGLDSSNGAVAIGGDEDFMIFDPALALGNKEFDEPPEVLRDAVLQMIGDTSNWTTADGGGNQNPGGSFDFNLGDLQGFPQPVNAQDDVTTLYFLGDQVAFVSAISDTGTATELTTAFNFEASDLIEIDIITKDIDQGGAVAGEFKKSQVIFTRVTVIREGVSYDLDVDAASQINASNKAPVAQGDSFFTTADDVSIPSDQPFGPFSGTLAFSIDEAFLDTDGNPIDPVIERERPELDTNGDGSPDGGPPVTNANFNVGTVETPPVIPCFVAGMSVSTPNGPRPVEQIALGDLVDTLDRGPQAVRWIGRVTVPTLDGLAPVVIRKGALGNPTDLRVSPQHRILLSGWQAELYFGIEEGLVAAKHLCNGRSIYLDKSSKTVDYVHLLFDHHELLLSSGIWSESYLPSAGHLSRSTAFERELWRLFPSLGLSPHAIEPARPCLRAYEGCILN